MNAKKDRLTILPVYSIILCMMVVLIHNHIPHYYEYGNNIVNNSIHYFLIEIVPNITDIAVPSFFILSGFLFFRNYNLNKTFEKYKSRIKTLLVPYLIWNIVGLLFEMLTRIPCFAALGKVNSNPFLLKSILCGIFLHQYTVLWFVFALMVYVVGAPIFYLLMKRKFWGILSLIVVVCCLVFDIIQVQLPNGCYFEESSLLYYMLGAYLGIHNKQFYGIKTSFVQAVVSILVFGALIYSELAFKNYLYRYETLILVAKSLSFWFFCSWACCLLKLRYWYNYSFFIYLCHLPIIRAISAIVRLMGAPIKNMLCVELFSYVLSFVITLFVCVALAFIWKKHSNNSFNLVTGSRG